MAPRVRKATISAYRAGETKMVIGTREVEKAEKAKRWLESEKWKAEKSQNTDTA